MSEIVIFKNSGVVNGYAYVDLGLPSGLKWATCNVGAANPWDNGDCFAWGETVGYGKSDPSNTRNQIYTGGNAVKIYYERFTYKWCSYTKENKFTKYELAKYNTITELGVVDGKIILDLEDDAARVSMGGSWRIPTLDELVEIRDNCYWVWTDNYNEKGVKGYIVYKVKDVSDKGKVKTGNEVSTTTTVGTYNISDAHIFLPATGLRIESDLAFDNDGYYWSSSLLGEIPIFACGMGFRSDIVGWWNNAREYGRFVRGVVRE